VIDFVALARTSKNTAELIQWTRLNGDTIGALEAGAPKLYGRVAMGAINQISEALPPLVEQQLPATAEEKDVASPTGEIIHALAEATENAPKKLPAKESAVLRAGLVRKLSDCHSIDDINAWKAKHDEGLGVLQDADYTSVCEFLRDRLDQIAQKEAA
jgi:hypothetical protein